MTEQTNPVSLPKRGLWRIFLTSLRSPMARRRAFAAWLTLSPARYPVGVETKLRIPMQDKVALLADHYYPKAAGDFPTVLIRSPLGRRWEKLPFSFAYMFA